MKVKFTLEEVEEIIRTATRRMLTESMVLPPDAEVRFMHRYKDGSGEQEVDVAGTSIDWVDVEVNLDPS